MRAHEEKVPGGILLTYPALSSMMRVTMYVTLGLLTSCYTGCKRASPDPQDRWQHVLQEDEEYLSHHEDVVSRVRENGGQVTAFREEPSQDYPQFSLVIDFSDNPNVGDAVFNDLLDGSPSKLFLRRTAITDAGLSELRHNSGIEVLDLYGTAVSDIGLTHISTLSSLKVLGLGNTEITDKGMSDIAKLSSLEKLSIPNNDLTDTGVSEVVGLRMLRQINLEHTKVTNDVVTYLCRMEQLDEVRLSGTRVTATGVARLERAIPKCRIVWRSE